MLRLFKPAFATSALALTCLMACSRAGWHETSKASAPLQTQVAMPLATPMPTATPITGDPLSDPQTVPDQKQPTQPGQTATVRPTNLCGHRMKSKNCDTQMEKGDEVEVVDPNPQDDGSVAVKPKASSTDATPPQTVYVPPQYLSTEPVQAPKEELAQDRYFVVQNIATEILRVYENCAWNGGDLATCHHKLVLQTPMVVGEDRPGKRTWLGSFRIANWQKFYQDEQNDFPSFYTEHSPQLPAPGSSLQAWISRSLLPNGRGSVRGAFGWYTARITPNADEQWLHGSWGWGADGGRFIDTLHSDPWDNDALVASHGCTRIENRAIAMLREFLVPGTKVIRIYARESYANSTAPANRTGNWDWALTRENSPEAPKAGRTDVEAAQVAPRDVLESGTYTFTAAAVAKPLVKAANPHLSGNVYRLPPTALRGVFLVDEGRTNAYAHPLSLQVGGLPGHDLPGLMRAR